MKKLYVNMLFDKGIYENISGEELIEQAKTRNAKFAVLLRAAGEPDPANVWNMYAFNKVQVYDLTEESWLEINLVNGEVVVNE